MMRLARGIAKCRRALTNGYRGRLFVREQDDAKGRTEVFGPNGAFASDCRALAELSASFRHFGGGPGGRAVKSVEELVELLDGGVWPWRGGAGTCTCRITRSAKTMRHHLNTMDDGSYKCISVQIVFSVSWLCDNDGACTHYSMMSR